MKVKRLGALPAAAHVPRVTILRLASVCYSSVVVAT